MKEAVKEILYGLLAGLFCLSAGGGFAWWARGVVMERQATQTLIATTRAADSLRLSLAFERSAAMEARAAAVRAESLYVADSARHLSAVRDLLARIAVLSDTTSHATPGPQTPEKRGPAVPTLFEIGDALKGCLLTAERCGDARAKAENEAARLRALNSTLQRQITNDSTARANDALVHAIALSRAIARNHWRDIKVGGYTAAAITAGCAVSHLGNPFRGP